MVWTDAGASSDIFVRHVLVDAVGANDLWGQIDIPDDALGGPNTSYIQTLAVNAFMHNTKLHIFTDDTDCVISSNGEDLGIVISIQVADL